MLVLGRKNGEGIRIGDKVRVVIIGVKGNKVMVGIEAPESISVFRDEVHERILEAAEKEGGNGIR
ncbi:MAG: carbon storage regulator CsrA [Planctomycetota bacterium]